MINQIQGVPLFIGMTTGYNNSICLDTFFQVRTKHVNISCAAEPGLGPVCIN